MLLGLALALFVQVQEPFNECHVCIETFIWPRDSGLPIRIREECDWTISRMTDVRARQRTIALEGNRSELSLEDLGEWYPPASIWSAKAVLTPPCI